MAARRDPLRTTLDTRQVPPDAQADRPYLVSVLRRLGYSEADIQTYLQVGTLPGRAPDATLAELPMVGLREYHLVLPIDPNEAWRGAGTDNPFEDLERLDFDPSHAAPLDFDPTGGAGGAGGRGGRRGAGDLGEDAARFEIVEEDPNYPGGKFSGPRKRVRMVRVRADSRDDAARRVASGGEGRNVLHSVPVRVEERWGPHDTTAKRSGKTKSGGDEK